MMTRGGSDNHCPHPAATMRDERCAIFRCGNMILIRSEMTHCRLSGIGPALPPPFANFIVADQFLEDE